MSKKIDDMEQRYREVVRGMREADPELPHIAVSVSSKLVPTIVLGCEELVRRFPAFSRLPERNIREVWMAAYQKRLDKAERGL